MAFGVKTNERPGTRATIKYARLSPSKARAVLDLIRNRSVDEARELLQFSDRGATEVVSKCLESAVANAENNDELPGDELFVSACYADEGPTLKRWRPRARGRATRIDKKTSHITVIVARYAPDELDARRERAGRRAAAGTSDAEARRRRVATSRGEDPEAEAPESDTDETEIDETEATDAGATATEAGATETNDASEFADSDAGAESDEDEEVVAASAEADEASDEDVSPDGDDHEDASEADEEE